jgi:hypothetical protein
MISSIHASSEMTRPNTGKTCAVCVIAGKQSSMAWLNLGGGKAGIVLPTLGTSNGYLLCCKLGGRFGRREQPPILHLYTANTPAKNRLVLYPFAQKQIFSTHSDIAFSPNRLLRAL